MIKGENISLRAPEMNDVDLLYKWENDTGIWHLSNTLAPFSRFTLEQYILTASNDIFEARQLRLMIELPDETTIGCIDLFEFEPHHKRAGIGIFIDNRYRGKKYASDALNSLVEYCFSTLQLKQVFCNICSDNEKSISLFKNAGFEVVGLKKSWIRKEDQWLDEYLLQKIKD